MKELALLLASVVFSFTLLEVGLRLVGFEPFRTRLQTYEFDEELGWSPRPSSKAYRSTSQYGHFNYFDRDGFPSDRSSTDSALSRDSESIALIGDSFVEGYYLPYEQTFAHLLGERTGKQILNLGVSGYSASQYLLKARRHLGEFRVSMILVFLFPFNDLPYIDRPTYQGYAKPHFTTSFTIPANLPLQRMDGSSLNRGVKAIGDRFAIWSVLKPLVGRIFLDFQDPWRPQKFSEQEFEKALMLVNQIHLDFPDPKFYVYYLPQRGELSDRDFFEHNTRLFLAVCGRLSIDCRLPEPFLKSDVDINTLYIPRDEHLSALGAKMIADHVYTTLVMGSDEASSGASDLVNPNMRPRQRVP